MNYPRILKLSKANLATIFLVLFYFSEGMSKYSIIYLDEKSDIPRYIKLIVFLFFGLYIIKPIRNLFLPILLLLVFSLGQFFLGDSFNKEIVVSFSKFLFPIFLFTYFNKYPLSKTSQKLLFQTFEYLLILNGILIFLGFFFDISLFHSYRFGRWGYNGLFINTSTSSYIYAVAIFYFLLSQKERFLKSWKTLFVIACCLLTGTKLVYIALFGSLLIYLLFYTNLNRKQRNVFIASIFAFSILLGYIFFFHLGIFNDIRQEQGLLSAILSYRDDLFVEETMPFIQENWRWPNYLFGGISDLAIRSQMGFIDVFLFWGVLGGLLYLFTFYKTYFTSVIVNYGIYIILILTLMVFLAGNFFENASIAIYMLILREKLMYFKTTVNE